MPAGHRDYGWGYEPVPDVNTPAGPLNTGYVTSLAPGAQWLRGDMPDMPDAFGFGLRAPRWMRDRA